MKPRRRISFFSRYEHLGLAIGEIYSKVSIPVIDGTKGMIRDQGGSTSMIKKKARYNAF